MKAEDTGRYDKPALFSYREIANLMLESRKAGIKEVVGFINKLIIGIDGCKFEERLDGDKGCIVLDMNENQWQSKLKEWGIE